MRGRTDLQKTMLAEAELEERVPRNHPLRAVRSLADAALERLSPVFDAMYARGGRPSVPPERLLKACLPMALCSVRSERPLCEQLEYSLLYRQFLDMDLMEAPFLHAVFSRNRTRLPDHGIGQRLFDGVKTAAEEGELMSHAYFSVDSALIAAAAGIKSFRPRDTAAETSPSRDDDPGNPAVDFKRRDCATRPVAARPIPRRV